jgi:hypothetical protein
MFREEIMCENLSCLMLGQWAIDNGLKNFLAMWRTVVLLRGECLYVHSAINVTGLWLRKHLHLPQSSQTKDNNNPFTSWNPNLTTPFQTSVELTIRYLTLWHCTSEIILRTFQYTYSLKLTPKSPEYLLNFIPYCKRNFWNNEPG